MLGFVAVLLRQKELHHLEPMSTDFNISESLRPRHPATIIVYSERRTASSASQVSSLRDTRKMLTW